MISTDTHLRKWKPDTDKQRVRCGDNLYIRGFASGRKIFQMRIGNTWIDLGDYGRPEDDMRSLAVARELTSFAKRQYKENNYSLADLKAAVLRAKSVDDLRHELERNTVDYADKSGIPTFDQAFRNWYSLQLKANTWRHKASARFPLTAYQLHVEAQIGNLRMDKITRPVIKQCMQPLFMSNSETARKLLGYIYKVFEDAYDDELIDGNPCPRKDSFTIPKRKVLHSSSLHYSKLPELWIWLDEAPFSKSVKVAMRLAIVTTHRAAVIANMQWDHIDCDTGIWTVPEAPVGLSEGFMKSGRQFSTKLPAALLEDVCSLPRNCDYVFSVDGRKPINAETLRRNFQKFDDITTHGFRNTFKTWCLNNDVDEFLADRYCDHALKGLDKNYRRDDLFDQRAALAQTYCDYVTGGA